MSRDVMEWKSQGWLTSSIDDSNFGGGFAGAPPRPLPFLPLPPERKPPFFPLPPLNPLQALTC